MFCPRCGAESPDDVRYCSACGAALPRRATSREVTDPTTTSRRGRWASRLRRVVGRTRRERVVSGITAGLLVVAVVGFIALDPVEDDATIAARDDLDAACVAAKAEAVVAANALTTTGGAREYALGVVVAMVDLRAAAADSEIDGVEPLRAAALDAAAAAGRVGRLARDGSGDAGLRAALQASAEALDGLSSPTVDLGLEVCASTRIEGEPDAEGSTPAER